jgi:hypothetical protein
MRRTKRALCAYRCAYPLRLPHSAGLATEATQRKRRSKARLGKAVQLGLHDCCTGAGGNLKERRVSEHALLALRDVIPMVL